MRRLPLGTLTGKVGGRVVFFVLMLACVVPIWLIGEATMAEASVVRAPLV